MPGTAGPGAGRLSAIRSSLAADGYEMTIARRGDRIAVAIFASAGTCEDCLVSKDLMRAMLSPVLGFAPDAIDLTYPVDDPGAQAGHGAEPGPA